MPGYFVFLKKHGVILSVYMLLGGFVTWLVRWPIIILVLDFSGPYGQTNGPPSLEDLAAFVLFFMLLYVITVAWQLAGSIAVTVEAIETNHTQMGTFFFKGFKYTLKMLGLFLLAYLLLVVIWFALVLLTVLSSFVLGPHSILLFLLGFVFFALLIVPALMHAPVILIAENTKVIQSLSRSYCLLRRAFGKVFVSGLLILLIYIGLFVLLLLISELTGLPIITISTQIVSNQIDSNNLNDLLYFNSIPNLIANMVLEPIVMMIAILLLVYRYFKYLRPYLNPTGISDQLGSPDTSYTPPFSLKEPDSSSSGSNDSFNQDVNIPQSGADSPNKDNSSSSGPSD